MKANTWHSVTVRCRIESEDRIATLLRELGADGTSSITADAYSEVTAYYPSDVPIDNLVGQITDNSNVISVQSELINLSDWADNWKQYYHPARLTRFLTVVPSWDDSYQSGPGELVIRLDPESSFGTGTHPTTVLALYALEQVMRGGEAVIDVGTGSGVLAIAASLLGAASVLALDNDGNAITIAQNNFVENGVQIATQVNDSLTGITQKADLIVANILAEILLGLISDATRLLSVGGYLILSGIYFDKILKVRSEVLSAGLTIQHQMSQGEWHCLIAKA